MIKKDKCAFTLVEVLIALAITGLLTVATLIAADEFREKAHDANVKSSLSHIRNVAEEVYYNTYPNSYVPVCFDSPVDLILTDVAKESGNLEQNYQCMSTQDTWIAIFPMKDGKYWCSDSSGNSQEVDGFLPDTDVNNMKCINAVDPDPEPELPPDDDPEPNTDPVLVLNNGGATLEIWTKKGNPFKNGAWKDVYEPGYTAADTEDGDLTDEVVVVGPVLTLKDNHASGPCSKERHYTVTYSVTDSSGASDGPLIRNVLHYKCTPPGNDHSGHQNSSGSDVHSDSSDSAGSGSSR